MFPRVQLFNSVARAPRSQALESRAHRVRKLIAHRARKRSAPCPPPVICQIRPASKLAGLNFDSLQGVLNSYK